MHKKYQHYVDWKGEEDYGATLLRGMVLFAPKTAAVGLRHLTHGVKTSTCQQVKLESHNAVNILNYSVTSN